jgi:mRNA-degrading endonuclease toxin of MazEF toxin-antitoxin module
MRSKIVRIGNSQGVRLPKLLIEQAGLEEEIELRAEAGQIVIAPLTQGGHSYPYRVPCRFQGKSGQIVLDQLRTIDHERLRKRLGAVTPHTLHAVLRVLAELFEI